MRTKKIKILVGGRIMDNEMNNIKAGEYCNVIPGQPANNMACLIDGYISPCEFNVTPCPSDITPCTSDIIPCSPLIGICREYDTCVVIPGQPAMNAIRPGID